MTPQECDTWNRFGFSPQCNEYPTTEQPVIVQPPEHTVPEPAPYALLGLELVVLVMALRRRK